MDIEYDAERRTYRAYYEPEQDAPSLALVEVIATIEEISPTALEPLGDTLEIEAFDAVLRSPPDDHGSWITLSYAGYDVAIHSDGVMELQPTGSDIAE